MEQGHYETKRSLANHRCDKFDKCSCRPKRSRALELGVGAKSDCCLRVRPATSALVAANIRACQVWGKVRSLGDLFRGGGVDINPFGSSSSQTSKITEVPLHAPPTRRLSGSQSQAHCRHAHGAMAHTCKSPTHTSQRLQQSPRRTSAMLRPRAAIPLHARRWPPSARMCKYQQSHDGVTCIVHSTRAA